MSKCADPGGGRQAAAADAILLLVQDALVQIRAMAHLRRDSDGDVAGGMTGDYYERMSLIISGNGS